MEAIALQRIGTTNVAVFVGDVTRQPVEAVVNSANEQLRHNEGVAVAVVRTGGRVIQEESDTWVREHGPVPPGTAAVTTGGMLQASHVIHAVGPYFDETTGDPVLASTVKAALDIARDQGLRSVALPMISSGARGYPIDRASAIITTAVTDWVTTNPGILTEIRLVGFNSRDAEAFASALSH